jgi:hypothetical protein
LFCYPPPSHTEFAFNTFNFNNTIEAYSNRPKPKLQPDVPADPHLEDESNTQVFVKQPNGRSNYASIAGKTEGSQEGKSSKKHYKMNKKK